MKIHQELIDQFARGNGALFIGAGLSIAAGLPGWGQLMDRLSKELSDYPLHSSYLDLAQYYVNEHKKNRLVHRLRDELDTTEAEPTSVHDAITKLGIATIFTTNFDNLIEKSLFRANVRFDKVITNVDPNFWTNERTQLVKLHGDLDYPDSIVITSEDYERYLHTHPALVRILTFALQTKTTLFLGYSANDLDIRSLLTLIQQESGEYARNAFSVMFDAHPSVIKDLGRRGITVINFENVADADKNSVLSEWLMELKEEVGKRSSISNRPSNKNKNLPSEPYKFLHWFGEGDVAIFHGRDYEIERLTSLVRNQKVTILYGESGTGKTSLLRAGVIPCLKEMGFSVNYIRPLLDPFREFLESLKTDISSDEVGSASFVQLIQQELLEDKIVVFVFDQFEEFFIRQGPESRRKFIQILIDVMNLPTGNIRYLFSLRSDYLDRLDELGDALGRDPLKFRMRLHNFGPANASAAISEPARDFNIALEQSLLDKLVLDLEQGGIAPPHLQIVCFVLWQDWIERGKPPAGLSLERYMQLGSTQSILAGYLINVIRDLESEKLRRELGIDLDSEKTQEAAKVILKSMITSERTKIAISGKEITQGELVTRLGIPSTQVVALLHYLQDHRIIRHLPETEYYELVHEVMIQQVWEWVSEEEKRLLDIQDLLVRAVTDHKKFQTPLSAEYLYLIEDHGNNLNLNRDAIELLLQSAIIHDHRPEIWVKRTDPGHAVQILAQSLATGRQTLYPQIARALGATKSTKAIRYLNDLLFVDDGKVQRSAAEAMSSLNVRGVIPSLFHAVMQQTNLQRAVPLIDALEAIRNEESTAMLLLTAANHTVPVIRSRAANALMRLDIVQGVDLLIRQLGSNESDLREGARSGLERIFTQDPDVLVSAYQNGDSNTRLHIINAFGRSKIPNIDIILSSSISDESSEVRKQGVIALGAVSEEKNVQSIISLLYDADANVRLSAVKALGGVYDVQFRKLLFDLLNDDVFGVRKEIVRLMVQKEDHDVVESMIENIHAESMLVSEVISSIAAKEMKNLDDDLLMLKYGDSAVRGKAIQSIINAKYPGTVSSLLAVMQSADVDARRSVAMCLGLLKDPQAIDALLATLADADAGVRRYAVIGLGHLKDPRAVEPFITALQDADAEVRRNAVIGLGHLKDPRAAEPFIAALQDADAEVRRNAVIGLGHLKDPRAVEPLITALQDADEEVRRAVRPVLGLFKEVHIVEPLIAAMQNADGAVRRYAVAALCRLKDHRIVDPLITALRDDDVEVRRYAVLGLQYQEDIRAVEPFIAAVQDADAEVRRNAVIGLGRWEDPRAIEPLITTLGDADVGVRRSSATALGFLRNPRIVVPLLAAMQDADADVRRNATTALGYQESPLAIEPFIAALQDADAEVRRSAAAALGHLRDQRIVDPLIAAMQDSDVDVRRNATAALGYQEDVRAVEPFISAIHDKDVVIRRNAIIGLGYLKVSQAIDLFISALQDADAEVRRHAAAGLGRLRDPRAVEPLIPVLKDANIEVRRSVAMALGYHADPRAVEPFIAAMKDADAEVRRNVIISLSHLDDPRVEESLIAGLQDPDDGVRSSVVIALARFGNKSSVNALIRLVQEEQNASVREQAKNTLIKLGHRI